MSLLCMNEIYLPVTDLERSLNWFEWIFGVRLEWRHADKVKISFSGNGSIVLVKSEELNRYTHIPFNLESYNMVKSLAMLKEKGVKVSKSSITDGFHCFDFFDPDGNRIGIVGSEVPLNIEQDEKIAVRSTFLAVKNIDRVVDWYSHIFGLAFKQWTFTGGAGYNSPAYEHDVTISYASADFLQRDGMAFAETPDVNPLVHMPYAIRASDAGGLYKELKERRVEVTRLREGNGTKGFAFIDLEGNTIGIVENE